MIIREAHHGDVPALSELARITYAETFGDGLTPGDLSSVIESTKSERYFDSKLPEDTVLVALDADRLVGYIQISDVRYKLEGVETTGRDQAINAIYVRSEYQGKGIGRMLMDAAFSHHRVKRAENIYIDVYEKNTLALRFYRKYGFSDAGKTRIVINGKTIGYDLVLSRKPSR